MLKNIKKQLGLSAVILLSCLSTQIQAKDAGEWNLSLDIKSNHLWHGFIVTDGVMTATSLEYKTEDKQTTYGLWGGGSFNGKYKEFTYYASHKFSDNLFVEIVNHGNHSSIPNGQVDIFNYSTDPSKTGNFTDIGLGYTFKGNTPISVYYSVIVQGIDVFVNSNTGKRQRSYTNYLEFSAPVWQGEKGDTVKAFIGGAFSPVQAKNFYSNNANINNVGFTYSKELKVMGTTFPVSATAMWNPALKIGALQVAVNLF